ncbi:MAG: Chromosome partition protein Smc [Chlamydiae bacterium]|nr:Chromosome partition protein Smc [Chlamydiota bacterium]
MDSPRKHHTSSLSLVITAGTIALMLLLTLLFHENIRSNFNRAFYRTDQPEKHKLAKLSPLEAKPHDYVWKRRETHLTKKEQTPSQSTGKESAIAYFENKVNSLQEKVISKDLEYAENTKLLKGNIAELQTQHDKNSSDLAQKNQLIQSLKTDLQNTQNKRTSLQTQLNELQSELAALKQRTQEMEHSFKKTQAGKNALVKGLKEKLQKENQNLWETKQKERIKTQTMRQYEEEIASLELQYKLTSQAYVKTQEQDSINQSQIRELQQALESEQMETQDLNRNLVVLNKKLLAANQAQLDLQSIIKGLEKQLQEENQLNRQLTNDKIAQAQHLEQKDNGINELHQQLDQANKTIAEAKTLELEIENTREELARIQEENFSLIKRFEYHASFMNNLQRKLKNENARYSDAQRDIANQKNTIQQKDQNIEQLEKQIQVLNIEKTLEKDKLMAILQQINRNYTDATHILEEPVAQNDLEN